ncbi:hypothetical protein CK203_080549 [Vitis vinifera]|uniref:Uncharacterized protein n=1 Tax=Vitis vinifera TaxID=29760 RepID=A0A438D9H2_VITVI|nr:hypothetical protein CK203_080549 [Vitis vinifera]
MEDLQWARLLVKRNGGSPPSLVERGKAVVTVAKEGGDASARAGARVGAMEDSRLEDCLTEDGTQSQPVGRVRTRIQLGAKTGLQSGPMHRSAWAGVLWEWQWEAQGKGRALGLLKGMGLHFEVISSCSSKAQMEKGSSAMERIRALRAQTTDSALLEEDARYVPSSSGMVALDPSPPFFLLLVGLQGRSLSTVLGFVESTKGDCLCKEIGHSSSLWEVLGLGRDQ